MTTSVHLERAFCDNIVDLAYDMYADAQNLDSWVKQIEVKGQAESWVREIIALNSEIQSYYRSLSQVEINEHTEDDKIAALLQERRRYLDAIYDNYQQIRALAGRLGALGYDVPPSELTASKVYNETFNVQAVAFRVREQVDLTPQKYRSSAIKFLHQMEDEHDTVFERMEDYRAALRATWEEGLIIDLEEMERILLVFCERFIESFYKPDFDAFLQELEAEHQEVEETFEDEDAESTN